MRKILLLDFYIIIYEKMVLRDFWFWVIVWALGLFVLIYLFFYVKFSFEDFVSDLVDKNLRKKEE